MNKIARIQELVKELNQYRHEYYNLNKPSVSDSKYDELFEEIEMLEWNTGFVLSNSPTQTVGYEVKSKLEKRTHPTPLKSLDKTKSIDELNKWRNNKDIILMLKADGLTVEVNYENGKFVGGYTRGNGEIGEVISHNCKVFKNLPLKIPFLGKLRLVGEAVIHKNDFDEINSKLSDEEKYATPRNLVAGSVRQLDSKICSERNVYWYCFGILEAIDTETNIDVLDDSKYENFKWLGNLGFWTIINTKCSENILNEQINSTTKIADTLNIPIDGLVVSFDSIKYSNSFGETSHHPLHSIAYKFGDETEETILRDVEWNTTRSGQINPTAIFDTVILDNTEVSRASLFNLTFIEDLQLNIGSRIKVSKRNMIIPYIEENLDVNIGLVEPPDECPSCGKQIYMANTGTAKFLFCKNPNCPAQLLDKFVHFVSRDAMNIEGMSEATLEKFIDIGWLKKFSDIYSLNKYAPYIISLDGFGIKSYNKLWSAIEKSKSVKAENFIYALGIPQVGKSASKSLAKYFDNDLGKFLDATTSHYQFMNISDFGTITAYNIYDYFQNKDNLNQFYDLLKFITILQDKPKEIAKTDNPFSSKKVYCTGTFESYKKEELQKLLEGMGAEFGSGYAKSLDYLIVGSIKGSSKEDKAKKDGVPILTEEEFLKMIGENV